MRFRGAIGVVFMAGMLVSPGHAVAETGPPETDLAFEDAVRFRSEMFLRTDDAYVRASLEDIRAFPDRTEWGVPLTIDEAAEMSRRAKVQEQVGPAAVWAMREAADFAGAYIDQKRRGLPIFLFASSDSLSLSGLAGRIPTSVEYEVRVVDRTWSSLLKTQGEIEAERDTFAERGLPFISTAVDTSSNTVVVGLLDASGDAAANIRERFGAAVSFRTDTLETTFDATYCWNDCLPEKGGIGAYDGDHTASKCTTGFIMKTLAGPSGAFRGITTAGHCFVWAPGQNGYGDPWRHVLNNAPDEGIGHAREETWFTNSDADFGIIDFTGIPTDLNDFVAYNDGTTRSMTHRAENAEQMQNGNVCSFGFASGRKCGTIKFPNVDRPSERTLNGTVYSKMLHNQWEVSFDSIGGDSGGPYFTTTNMGFGTHVHSGSGSGARGWYSTLEWIGVEYNQRFGGLLTFCETSTC